MHIRPNVDRSNPAVVLHPSGTRLTFAELESRANRLAHFLRDAGLREGDTVALMMDNGEHTHAVMWAARRCGLYYAMINTHLTPAEAAYIIGDSGAVAVIASSAMRDVCAALPAYFDGGLPALRVLADDDLDGWLRYPECVTGYADSPLDDEREGDLLQYSSGTTGRPKGIRRELPHAEPMNVPSILTPLLEAVGLTGDSVYLSPAPLYHTAPAYWSMSVQALGGTVVVMERFDPEKALDAIERYQVTHGQFVPAMFVRMLKLDDAVRSAYDVSSLRRVVHAAAPCPVEIKKQMIAWWGPIVDEYYAASEAVGASFIKAEDWLAHPGSVGRPLVGTPHILDDDGHEVPTGVVGTIFYDGGLPFTYLNDAVKTAQARDGRGWVTVGDVGYVDDEGYLYLTDRRSHVIISGGVNIYPQEAENLLVTHPDVLDAAVFGVPDADMGQSVMAVVQLLHAGAAGEAMAAHLLEWTRERLAHYKCPRRIVFEPVLPRSDAGKLYKRHLVEKYSTT